MAHVDAVASRLFKVPVSQYVSDSPVVAIEASTSLKDALKILKATHVTGAPVYFDNITSVRSHLA